MDGFDLNAICPVCYAELKRRGADWGSQADSLCAWRNEKMGSVGGDVAELPVLTIDPICNKHSVRGMGPKGNRNLFSGKTEF